MSFHDRLNHAVLLALASQLVFVSAGAAQKAEKRVSPTAAALADFNKRLDNYVEMQKKLAEAVGPLDETKNPAEIATRVKALGEALKAARANAKQGDIFTPPVASIFKKVMHDDHRRRSAQVKENRRDAQEELKDFKPAVNQIYPTTYPLATFPPSLLRLLPMLPKEVEYRLVQRHLILRDIEANLILDFIPSAAPPL